MKTDLLKIAIRQNAIYLPTDTKVIVTKKITSTTSVLVANAHKLGFSFSENLLHALNASSPTIKLSILEVLKEIAGVNKNWTPLVKGWDEPTGESITDHVMTFFANVFQAKGTRLQCGHIIPANTFPLERYNGCPFCGTPFEFDTLTLKAQGSMLKVLELWNDEDVYTYFCNLLGSKTALDATQVDSLKIVLTHFTTLPKLEIGMKETLMLVIDQLVSLQRATEVTHYFKSPTDVLLYLWYKKTGFLQIIEPKTIVKRQLSNTKSIQIGAQKSAISELSIKANLELKYSLPNV